MSDSLIVGYPAMLFNRISVLIQWTWLILLWGIPFAVFPVLRWPLCLVVWLQTLCSRVQVREKFGCASIPSNALISLARKPWHTTKENHCILQKSIYFWIIRERGVWSASAGKAKCSLHDLHLLLPWSLGGDVHSRCFRDLEKTADRAVVTESMWCCLEKWILCVLQLQGLGVMLDRGILTQCFPYPACAQLRLWSLLVKQRREISNQTQSN